MLQRRATTSQFCSLSGINQSPLDIHEKSIIIPSLSSEKGHFKAGPLPCALDSDYNIIDLSIEDNIFWNPFPLSRLSRGKASEIVNEVENRRNYFKTMLSHELLRTKEDVHIRKPCIWLASNFGWYPYGHLHDYLQKLYTLIDFVHENKNDLVFLCSNHKKIKDFDQHLSALAGFNVNPEQILVLDYRCRYKVDLLAISGHTAPRTSYTEQTLKWVKQSYARHFIQYTADTNMDLRYNLYLTRNHVKAGERNVLNENEILNLLTRNGYSIINGTESLKDVYLAFLGAKNIIAPHGSLLVNTVFCQNACRIYEFCPDSRIDESFRYKNNGVGYYDYTLVPSDERYNINLPIDTIKKILSCNK